MNDESNFIYNVMTNGIGGINAGGRENDVNPWRGSHDVIDEINIFRYLTRDPEMAKLYYSSGYLKLVNEKGSLSHKYRITQKGKDTYSGSKVVNDWMSNNNKIISLREQYKKIKNGLSEEEKEHFLNEINDLVKRY